MKTKILMFMLALAATPTWAETITARQCTGKTCSTWKVERLSNHRLSAWADARLKKDLRVNQLDTATLNQRLKKAIDNSCAAEFQNGIRNAGRTAHFQQLKISASEYTCGAHGMTTESYAVFANNAMQPLSLQNIVLPNQMAKLNALQKDAWIQYLKTEAQVPASEIPQFLADNTFKATNNWRFGKNGLVFQFQPYEIAAYAFGAPALTIPANRLQGVVKPEILREIGSFQSK